MKRQVNVDWKRWERDERRARFTEWFGFFFGLMMWAATGVLIVYTCMAILTGCARKPKAYVGQDGVRCAHARQEPCGLYLFGCDDGQERRCMQNVNEVY